MSLIVLCCPKCGEDDLGDVLGLDALRCKKCDETFFLKETNWYHAGVDSDGKFTKYNFWRKSLPLSEEEKEENMYFGESGGIISGEPSVEMKEKLFDLMIEIAKAFYKLCNSDNLIEENSYSKTYVFDMYKECANKVYSRADGISILLTEEKIATVDGYKWVIKTLLITYNLKSDRKLTFLARVNYDGGDDELIISYNQEARYMNSADVTYAYKHLLSFKKVALNKTE